MRIYKKCIVVLCILAIMVAGCSSSAPTSPINEQIQELSEYVSAIDFLKQSEPGIYKGIGMTPILNKTVANNGVEFTVHQVIVDAIRTIVIYSFELQKDDEGKEIAKDLSAQYDHKVSGEINIKELRGRLQGYFEYNEKKQRSSGIATSTRILDRDLKTITVEAKDIGGIEGIWSVEVPVYYMEEIEGREIETYEMLRTEELGIGFTIIEMTLASTGTHLEWVFREMLIYENDLDYTLVRNSPAEHKWFFPYLMGSFGPSWKPEFIMKTQMVGIQDKHGNDYKKGLSLNSSREGYFPPIDDSENLKVYVKNALLKSKTPASISFAKNKNKWKATPFRMAGTTVTIEEVTIGEQTSIKLRYQGGTLGEMMGAYILDDGGNRYDLQDMVLKMPAYDKLEQKLEEYNRAIPNSSEADIEKHRNNYLKILNDFKDNFEKHKKYQVLQFPSLPNDVDSFTLMFDDVYYVPDQVWEIKIQ